MLGCFTGARRLSGHPPILATAAALLSINLNLLADQPAALFHSNSREVLLDVVVTDRRGKPIWGLSQNDFVVLENGSPQRITFFEAPKRSPSEKRNPAQQGHTVLLFDELNLTFSDLAYARYSTQKYITEHATLLQSTALMAITPHGLELRQPFTTDRRLLSKALAALPPVIANPDEEQINPALAAEHANAALAALEQIARAAVGDSARLNLIWITNGFRGVTEQGNRSGDVTQGVRRLANLLLASRLGLYAIDPSGVLEESSLQGPTYHKSPTESAETASQRSAALMLSAARHPHLAADLLLEEITSQMGGRSYYNRNDVDRALQEATLDGASSYVITYSPSNASLDGTYRKITVRTKQQGAETRTRAGYYAIPSTSDARSRDALLRAALASPLAYSGQKIACEGHYDARLQRLKGKLVIGPSANEPAAETRKELIWGVILSKDRKVLGEWGTEADLSELAPNRSWSVPIEQALPRGATQVRVVVSASDASRIGTCEFQVPAH